MLTENQIIVKLTAALQNEKVDYQKILELSKELAKQDKEKAYFEIDAGALIHLGRDSIKDHTTALIELVKNSYDADATYVDVNISSKEGYIKVVDNGHGMTPEEVINKWLRIGFSEKRKQKITKKTRRRRTGEKGIGRLSADRLGSKLVLLTKAENSIIFSLEINWDDFDNQGKDLTLVPIKINSNSVDAATSKLASQEETGTELIITGLRNTWTDFDLKNLWQELSILTPPVKFTDNDFNINLYTDIETVYKGKVLPPNTLESELSLSLEYKEKTDYIVYSIRNKYNLLEEQGKVKLDELVQRSNYNRDVRKVPLRKNLECGPVKVSLQFYPRDTSMIKGTEFKLKTLQEYLDRHSGVKIYRDNISVKPYGFPDMEGSDWLDLSNRQGRNPAGIGRPDWAVKPNQLTGAVFISRDNNQRLSDSAGREGLIQEDAFYDLRALVLTGVRLLETHRYTLYQHNPKERQERKSSREILEEYRVEISKLKEELGKLKEENKHNLAFSVAKAQMDLVIEKSSSTEKTIDEILDKSRTLAGLATLGIASAVFGHETQTSISGFKTAVGNVQMLLEFEKTSNDRIMKELDKALKYSDQVLAWGSFALARVRKDKRKRSKQNISELIRKILREIEPNLSSVGIKVEEVLSDVTAKVFVMDIEAILLNLLTNAYSACLQRANERTIRVELNCIEEHGNSGYEIVVADSGPGINENQREAIWSAFYTTKVDEKGKSVGTGLGLTIVDSIIEDLQGHKTVDRDPILSGAIFKVWLPKG